MVRTKHVLTVEKFNQIVKLLYFLPREFKVLKLFSLPPKPSYTYPLLIVYLPSTPNKLSAILFRRASRRDSTAQAVDRVCRSLLRDVPVLHDAASAELEYIRYSYLCNPLSILSKMDAPRIVIVSCVHYCEIGGCS